MSEQKPKKPLESEATDSTEPSSKSGSKTLLKSSAIFGFMTTLSRVLGLVRDIIFARYIGAEAGADAFFVAFKIPNFMRRLFSEGAFAQAFVPVLAEYREQGVRSATQLFVNHVAGCLGVTLLGVTAFAVMSAPVLAIVFAPGFYLSDPGKHALTSDLIRITFPYLMLISLTGLLGAIQNSYDRFAIPAFTPVLLNVVLISAAIFVSPLMQRPAEALAWGVLVAGIVQFGFQIPFVMQIGLLPKPVPKWRDPAVIKVLKLMGPAMFGVSVSQINLLLDTVLASFLPTGSVSWLYYSDRLTELPLGVFGVAIATVILPTLSRQFSSASGHFSKTLDWGLRTILVVSVPAALALFVLAEPILYTLFQYDATRPKDIEMSALSLKAYALGLSAFMLIKILASAFYSRQDTRTPVRIGIIAMVANMGLNLLFVLPLYFIWSMGHVGLALATSASAFLNAGLLLRGLLKQGVYTPERGWLLYFGKLGLSSIVMTIFIAVCLGFVDSFAQMDVYHRIINTTWICLSGLILYAICLFLMGIRLSDLKPRT